jgi:hypothetical protein
MSATRKTTVTFISPGTFVAESTTKGIESRDIKKAVAMAAEITERYNAKPYAFYFSTVIEHPPIDDGDGGTLTVNSKELETTGMYFLTGEIETYDDVIARNDPKENILRSNMEQTPIVVVNKNSFKSTTPFHENDFIVDLEGNIIAHGDEPKWKAYRKQHEAKQQAKAG